MARHKYPGADGVEEYKKNIRKRPLDDEPDMVETASGVSPNYEKFDRMGVSAEQALVWCNMD